MCSFRLISLSRSQIVNVHCCHSRFYKTSSFNLQSQKESYRILGLSEGADEKEIKQAYFQLAKKYHPDRNEGDKNAQIKFQELTNAYERLTNKKKNTDDEFDFSQHRSSSGFSEEYSKEHYEYQQQNEAYNLLKIKLLRFYYRFRTIIWIVSSLGLFVVFRYTLQIDENNTKMLRSQYGLNLNYHPQNEHVRKINPKKNKTAKKTLENSDKENIDKENNVSYNQSWYK